MSAPGSSRLWSTALAALALCGSLCAVAQVSPAPRDGSDDAKRGEPASPAADANRGEPAPPRSVDGRYGIQVLAATVNVYADASPRSTVLAQLQQGARLEADQRRGNWYRIHLGDG